MYAKNQHYYISDTNTWKSEGFDDTCYRKEKSHGVSCLDFGCFSDGDKYVYIKLSCCCRCCHRHCH